MNESPDRVLLAYDGSENAKRAIAVAGRLFGRRSALVLHFWESWADQMPALASASATVQGMATERSRCLNGISAALGSISNGVVHHSRRPVLVVPTEEDR